MKPKQKSEGLETMKAEEQLEKLMILTLEGGTYMKTIFRYHEMIPRGCNGTELCCRTSYQSRMEWALSSEQSGLP